MPVVGRDYPGTWQAFEAWFGDEDACREYLEGSAVAGWVRVPGVPGSGRVADRGWLGFPPKCGGIDYEE